MSYKNAEEKSANCKLTQKIAVKIVSLCVSFRVNNY